jgi:hypothetical protein
VEGGGGSWKRVLFAGKQWQDRQAPIHAIAIDPSNPKIVYAGTETGANDGIHRSAGGGATWMRYLHGLPENFRIQALVVDPRGERAGAAARRRRPEDALRRRLEQGRLPQP